MNRIVLVLLIFIIIPFKLISSSEIDSLENRLKVSITDIERLQTYYELAKLASRHSKEAGDIYIQQALNINPKTDDPEVEIAALLLMGDLHRENDNFLNAYRMYQKAMSLSNEINSTSSKIKCLIRIADFYYKILEYDKSLDICRNAEKVNKGNRNKLTADILLYEGMNYKELSKLDTALVKLKDAQKIYSEFNTYSQEVKAIVTIGKIYLDIGEYDEAIKHELIALEIAKSNNAEWVMGLIYNDLGWAYYKKDNFEKSLNYNLKALELRRQLNGIYAETSSLLNIGILYKNYGYNSEAIDYINRAWIMAKEFPENMLNNSKRRCSKNLYEIYESMGMNQEALHYLKIYNEAITNFDSQSKNLEIEKLKATLRIDSIEEKEIIKSQHYKQKMILIITIITVIGLILLQILFSSYTKKKQQNLDLQYEIENRKKIESELKSSKDRLKLLNTILRHDLTNDIAVINSAINIYHRTPSDELLNVMQNRIKKIVERIGYYKTYESIIDTNSNLMGIDVRELIEGLLPEFTELNVSVEGDGKVLADETIDSVFVNLFKNAVLHGSATIVKVKISTTSSTCRIEFSDNGKHIPEKIKEEIFKEGFSYGDTGHTGIGLYIVRTTLENYDGSIYAIDNELGGTTFVITMNLAL